MNNLINKIDFIHPIKKIQKKLYYTILRNIKLMNHYHKIFILQIMI